MSEIWYARLLRLYPPGHPRDEMLDVLLAAGRPAHREIVPLVLGALRARSGGDQPLTVRWLYAARAAALMLLVATAVGSVHDAAAGWLPVTTSVVLVWIAVTVAVLAVLAGLRAPAAAGALTAFVVVASAASDWRAGTGYALAAALLLIPGPGTRVLNPLPLLLAAAVPWTDRADILLALVAAALLWAVVDERLLLALGLASCVGVIQTLGYAAAMDDVRAVLAVVAVRLGPVAVFLAVGGGLALRRVRL